MKNMIEINLYSHTPISFTIQFQTLIFVIFANRVNICIVCKILVYLQYSRKTLYYFEFLNSFRVTFSFYLCPNT